MAKVTNEPRDHHVVPQFYLRNFAVDEQGTKVTTLARTGELATWMQRSIKGIGHERDFYVQILDGRPVSVETDINRRIETPISRSDTWAKIASGRSADWTDPTVRSFMPSSVIWRPARRSIGRPQPSL